MPESSVPQEIPENLWVRCTRCGEMLYVKEFEKNFKVCHKCDFHFRLSARERLDLLLDHGSFMEKDDDLLTGDPLGFVSLGQSYPMKIADTQRKTGLKEAVISGCGALDGIAGPDRRGRLLLPGRQHGLRLRREGRPGPGAGAGRAPAGGRRQLLRGGQDARGHLLPDADGQDQRRRRPPGGGLRALRVHPHRPHHRRGDRQLRLPGGRAHRGAGRAGGFAGPRVIEQITKQKLPAGTATAEFALEHGMVDMVVHRRDLRPTLARLLRLYQGAACHAG